VPCHACGSFQVLKWAQVKWDNGLATKEARAASAYYECEHCQAHWNDVERWRAVEIGRWLAGRRLPAWRGFTSTSCVAVEKLCEIVLDFLTKKDDPEQLKTFVNTTLAETWKQGETPDWEKVYARREDYPLGTVPMRALMLVAAVDVQHNRLEFEAVAYAPNRNRVVWYEVIPGDPANITAAGPGRNWMCCWRATGRTSPAAPCRSWQWRLIPGSRGARMDSRRRCTSSRAATRSGLWSGRHARVLFPYRDSSEGQRRCVQADLRCQRDGRRAKAAGRPDLDGWDALGKAGVLRSAPVDRARGRGVPARLLPFPAAYEKVYFQGLCSERRVVRASGKVEWEQDSVVRNEPLDLRGVYARAAAELCDLTRLTREQWAFVEEAITNRRPTITSVQRPAPIPASQQPRYMGGMIFRIGCRVEIDGSEG